MYKHRNIFWGEKPNCMTFLVSGYQQEIQEAKSAFCRSQACSFWLCAFILLFISWFAVGSAVLRASRGFSSCSERGCSPRGAARGRFRAPALGLRSCGAALGSPLHVAPSRSGEQTHVLCSGRQVLNAGPPGKSFCL